MTAPKLAKCDHRGAGVHYRAAVELELDRVVRAGIGVRQGETINDAARRALQACRGRRLRAARALLSVGAPWHRMALAAAILRGLPSRPIDILMGPAWLR